MADTMLELRDGHGEWQKERKHRNRFEGVMGVRILAWV